MKLKITATSTVTEHVVMTVDVPDKDGKMLASDIITPDRHNWAIQMIATRNPKIYPWTRDVSSQLLSPITIKIEETTD